MAGRAGQAKAALILRVGAAQGCVVVLASDRRLLPFTDRFSPLLDPATDLQPGEWLVPGLTGDAPEERPDMEAVRAYLEALARLAGRARAAVVEAAGALSRPGVSRRTVAQLLDFGALPRGTWQALARAQFRGRFG